MARTRPGTHGERSIVDTVAETLRSGINEGRYAPGQRLIDTELSTEFSVSRGTVRAALAQLKADGIVEPVNGRGASVARLSRKEVADLFQVRAWLDGLAARLAAQHIDRDGNRFRLESTLTCWDDSETLGNAAIHMRENARFHDLIRDIAGNCRLPKVISQMQLPGYRIRFQLLLDPPNLAKSASEHKAISRAILDGDSALAEELARAHSAFANSLLQKLPDWEFRA